MSLFKRGVRYIVRCFLRLSLNPRPNHNWAFLGSRYGGWWLPVDRLPKLPVCVCAGAGEDVTFDVELIRTTGATVVTVDPTPRAVEHVTRLLSAARTGGAFSPLSGDDRAPYNLSGFDPHKLRLIAKGLAAAGGVLRFYAPRDGHDVSHSISNLQGSAEYFEAPCLRLRDLMAEVALDHLDLLKLDIEGAEHGVLRDMLKSGIRPAIVCVEFDQPARYSVMSGTIGALKASGYRFERMDRWNLTFVLDV